MVTGRLKKMEIVKIQIPIFTNAMAEALIYNEDRSIEVTLPITKDLRKIMKKRPKAYFYAEVKNKLLHIDTEAPWQDW